MNFPVELATLWLFVPAALALNLTPGNDMLLCLGQGLNHGPRAGVAASFGVSLGVVVHTLLAAFGLAALLAVEPVAFELIRWTGIAYLLYLAWQGVFKKNDAFAINNAANVLDTSQPVLAKHFKQGLIVNLLNPHVAVFILAFLPQFVDPGKGSTITQFLFLGAIPIFCGTIINSLVAIYAGRIGRSIKRKPAGVKFFNYLTSAIFVGLAFKLAIDR